VVPPAEIGVEACEISRRFEAPTAIAQTLRGEVSGVVADLYAVLCVAGEATEGAALDFAFQPLVRKAVLHGQIDRPAERIEPEDRIVGPEVGAVDGDGRNEIPVYRVAKRLVKADPAHVHGDPL